MGAQLDRLIEAAGLPEIVVQVLPFRARDNAWADGTIAIYEFAEAPPVCYTECYSDGRIVEGRDEVAGLTTVMRVVARLAGFPLSGAGGHARSVTLFT